METKQIEYEVKVITKMTGRMDIPKTVGDVQQYIINHKLEELMEEGKTSIKVEYEVC